MTQKCYIVTELFSTKFWNWKKVTNFEQLPPRSGNSNLLETCRINLSSYDLEVCKKSLSILAYEKSYKESKFSIYLDTEFYNAFI